MLRNRQPPSRDHGHRLRCRCGFRQRFARVEHAEAQSARQMRQGAQNTAINELRLIIAHLDMAAKRTPRLVTLRRRNDTTTAIALVLLSRSASPLRLIRRGASLCHSQGVARAASACNSKRRIASRPRSCSSVAYFSACMFVDFLLREAPHCESHGRALEQFRPILSRNSDGRLRIRPSIDQQP